MQTADYYEILGVSKNSLPEEIKKAYRNLVKLYHPDVNQAANAATFFRLIQEAYEVLSDPQKKYAYDCNGGTSKQDYDYQDDHYDDGYEAGYQKTQWDAYTSAADETFSEVHAKTIYGFKYHPVSDAELYALLHPKNTPLRILRRILAAPLCPLVFIIHTACAILAAIATIASWIAFFGFLLIACYAYHTYSQVPGGMSTDQWIGCGFCIGVSFFSFFLPRIILFCLSFVCELKENLFAFVFGN